MDTIIAFQLDELSKLNVKTDSSLLVAKAFYQRGYSIFYYTPPDLSIEMNTPYALGSYLKFQDDGRIIPSAEFRLNLNKTRCVFIRQNPPFDMHYITSLYILQLLDTKILAVNTPGSILLTPEKISVLNYAAYIPSSIITNHIDRVNVFLEHHRTIILKPLYGYGGQDIILINHDYDQALIQKYITEQGYIIAQKFLPEVKSGDTRAILIDGELIGAFKRVPAKDEIRANMVLGGKAEITTLSNKTAEMLINMSRDLKRQGIFLAGIDLIGDYLIEINVTSPTGLVHLNELYNMKIGDKIVNKIESKIRN